MNRHDRRNGQRELVEGTLFLRITGGCDDCDAYSDLIDHGAHVFTLAVRHDDSCPAFKDIQKRAAGEGRR